MKNNTFEERRKKLQSEVKGYEKELNDDFKKIRNVALIAGLVVVGFGVARALTAPKKQEPAHENQTGREQKDSPKKTIFSKIFASMQDFIVSSAIDMLKNQLMGAFLSFNKKNANETDSEGTERKED